MSFDHTLMATCFDTLRTALSAAQVKLLIGHTDSYDGDQITGLWSNPTLDSAASMGGVNAGFGARAYVKVSELPTLEHDLTDGDKVEIVTVAGEANKVRRIDSVREIGRNQTTGKPVLLCLNLIDEFDQ